jgi:hypothetical protein
MTRILRVHGRGIFGSRGNPTLEVDVDETQPRVEHPKRSAERVMTGDLGRVLGGGVNSLSAYGSRWQPPKFGCQSGRTSC